MAAQCRNRIAGIILSAPAYLLVGALCVVGLIETSSELGDQNRYFLYSALALLGCAVSTWIFNIRQTRLGIVDLAAAMFLAWWVGCYFIHDSIAASRLIEMSLAGCVYVSLRVILPSYRNLGKWLFVVLCICGIIEATIGIGQAFGFRHSNHNLFRVTGTFFNPGPYGGYLALMLSMALGYLAKNTRGLGFWIATGTAISIFVILPATMSRAAFVAVGVAVVAIALSNERVRDYARRHKMAIALTALVVCSAGAWGIYALKKDSADGRMLMWKMSAKVMADNPVTGVGQGYWAGAFGDAQAEYFRSSKRSETEVDVAGCPEYGFNEYLQIGAETGVPGLVLFAFLVAAALLQLLKARSPGAFGLIAFSVFAFFSYPFAVLPMKILFVVLIAVAGGKQKGILLRPITAVALAGCLGAVIFVAKPYIVRIEASKDWQTKRHWYSAGIYSYVLEDYPELLPLMGDNPRFMFEYGRSLNLEGRHTESIDVLTRAAKLSSDPMIYNVIGNSHKSLGEYNKAAEAYTRAHCAIPGRMYPLYLLAKMYSETGDASQARHYARLVIEMTPKILSPATREMQHEMEELL